MPGLQDLIGALSSGQQGGGSAAGGLEGMLGGMLGGGSASSGSSDPLGGLLGGMLGAGGGGGPVGGGGSSSLIAMLAPILAGLLANGGLSSILGGMRANGLSAQADSWVSTGANQPIEAEHVEAALGADRVSEIAQQLGVPAGQASQLLAQVLPSLVNSVTPEGTLPPDSELNTVAGLLKGFGG